MRAETNGSDTAGVEQNRHACSAVPAQSSKCALERRLCSGFRKSLLLDSGLSDGADSDIASSYEFECLQITWECNPIMEYFLRPTQRSNLVQTNESLGNVMLNFTCTDFFQGII